MPTSERPSPFPCPRRWLSRVQQVVKEEGRTMREFLRDAIRLYMEEREWLRQERRQRAKARRNDQE